MFSWDSDTWGRDGFNVHEDTHGSWVTDKHRGSES